VRKNNEQVSTTNEKQQVRSSHGQGATSEKKPWTKKTNKEQPQVGATTQQKQKKKSNQNLQTTNLA
jgi:hypothetical protein